MLRRTYVAYARRVEDAQTIERTAAATARLIAPRYRVALRARFLADRIGSDARSAELLDERLLRFEETAYPNPHPLARTTTR